MSIHNATPIAADSVPSSDATLGARLAAASRCAQGFPSAVNDLAVLAELRELCIAPRPVIGKRDGPAP